MEALLVTLASLAGVSAFFAVLINIGKRFDIVNDGTAPAWSLGLNLVGIVLIFANDVFGLGIEWSKIDTFALAIAELGTAVLAFVAMLGSTRGANAIVRGVPLVGYSHSS